MKRLGLQVRYPKKFMITTDSTHHHVISPNTLNRDFDITASNKAWTTNITYAHTSNSHVRFLDSITSVK